MNNIEMEALKADLRKYLKFTDEELNRIHSLNEVKLSKLKKNITKIKNDEYKKNQENIKRKIDSIFSRNPELLKQRILERQVARKITNGKFNAPKPKIEKVAKKQYEQGKKQYVNVPSDRKPRILFITDVKGWAWWIKSEYIKKYLSDEFDIDIVNIIDNGSNMQFGEVDQFKYDLYFSYGFSYIDFLTRVPKKKKVVGVTAHRRKNVIFPKMKMAAHHHANSILLLKELQDMGFKRAYYVPNGVDIDLFKPIKTINPKKELIIGHVGKECPAKGQREFILPAIQSTGCKSATNLRTWKNKLPHSEMPKIYQEMDVFMVASIEDGTPNPALEAAACGRPIISNKIGNMPNLIKDGYNGFIVPRKIGAYIEKINYFKQNPDELVRMGNNARKSIVDGWSWELMSRNYLKMFDDIFDIKRDPSKYENPALYH